MSRRVLYVVTGVIVLSLLMAIVVLSFPNVDDDPPKVSTESLETIGGLATHVLFSSNMNIGLTMELRKADAADANVVLTSMTMVESHATTNINQLEASGRKTELTQADKDQLELLLEGLRGVKSQAAAVIEAFQNDDNTLLEKYYDSRTETAEIIRKIVED